MDLASGLILLDPDGRVQTAKRRPKAPIDDRLRPALPEAWRGRTCAHVIEYGGSPINSIRKAFKETALRAGFAPKALRPCTLRDTAATWMAQRGAPIREIAGFLGHGDTRMVERTYAHHHPDHMKRAADALGGAMAGTGLASHPMLAALARAIRRRSWNVAKNVAKKPRKRAPKGRRGPITH